VTVQAYLPWKTWAKCHKKDHIYLCSASKGGMGNQGGIIKVQNHKYILPQTFSIMHTTLRLMHISSVKEQPTETSWQQCKSTCLGKLGQCATNRIISSSVMLPKVAGRGGHHHGTTCRWFDQKPLPMSTPFKAQALCPCF
jgi:hypothetical protein